MASKKKRAAAAAGGAAATAKAAKDNRYVQEIVENDDLRDNIQQAYESARDAYDRIATSKKPAKAIFDDKKLQKDLKTAADSIREAGLTLKEAPGKATKSSGGGVGRKLLIVIVAAGLALALSEDLRKKVLDMLFGAEEEFEYTSTSTPNGGGAAGGVSTPAASTT